MKLERGPRSARPLNWQAHCGGGESYLCHTSWTGVPPAVPPPHYKADRSFCSLFHFHSEKKRAKHGGHLLNKQQDIIKPRTDNATITLDTNARNPLQTMSQNP